MDDRTSFRRAGVSRRSVLRAGLAGGAVLSLPSLLSACGKPEVTSAEGLQIASPDNPVRWPIHDDVPMIESGLTPEKGSTLRLYNYADYLAPRVIKDFEAEYDVKVELSTFNDTEEALSKISSGALAYDIYFPSYDQIGKMVTAKLVRPLNHDYIPHIENCWPQFSDPWYDQGWQYSVPYTTYTTGIGWRTDMVDADIGALDNPYDSLWDPQYRDNCAVIDDWHTCMTLPVLRDGTHDVNAEDPDVIAGIREAMLDLRSTTNPKVTVNMYNDLPAGQFGLSQMWSGDIINAVYYLPKKVKPDVLRYWFPEDGKGLVDNDLMMVLAGGENPVAAHFFINYILDEKVSKKNFGWTGYQPPQNSLDPDTLVADGYLPENLRSATVLPEWFDTADRLLGMPLDVEQQWLRVWQEFKAGG